MWAAVRRAQPSLHNPHSPGTSINFDARARLSSYFNFAKFWMKKEWRARAMTTGREKSRLLFEGMPAKW